MRKMNYSACNMPSTKDPSSSSRIENRWWRRPDARAAFILHLTLRLASALFNHISDCDETFNYWEPISKLTFGYGMQTWEYSPVFAIRSYLYLWFYAFPARILQPFVTKLMIFYLIRCFLALFCTACEIFFLKGVQKRFGYQVAFITYIILAFSAGMFNASTAILPSTFSMYFCLLSFAGYFLELHRLTLFVIGVSALVGWPFSAIIGYQYDSKALHLTSFIFYLWTIIFNIQAHKEERFLFAIYPLICLLAAISLIQLKCFLLGKWLTISFGFVFILLSLSRIMAIYTGYQAPLETFGRLSALDELYPSNQQIIICMGKEWYRYPSSFFLPNSKWRLGFVSSSFKGQLPQPFSESTCTIQSNFNELNQEEPSRYTEPIDCDYLIDSDFSTNSPLDPNYSQQINDWATVYTSKILDPNRSSKLFRAFYFPIISPSLNTYVNFNVLLNRHKHLQTTPSKFK